MTMIVPSFDNAVVVREVDAEVLGWTPMTVRLLADSSATGGALSVMRTTIGEGTEGARPHTHTRSAELFYVLDGELHILTGDRVVTAGKGDLVVYHTYKAQIAISITGPVLPPIGSSHGHPQGAPPDATPPLSLRPRLVEEPAGPKSSGPHTIHLYQIMLLYA